MNSKSIAIFGCKSTTQFLIENLIDQIKIEYLVTIDEVMALKNEVADFKNLESLSKKYGIKKYNAVSYSLKSEDDYKFFTENKIDLAFVVGWQRLIPELILNTFSIGAFGMHGSSMDLPLGRGRSPMNWAIIEGKQQFYTNLFMYDPGIDSGDVLDTYKFQIHHRDTAETMHYKNVLAMIFLIKKNLPALFSKSFSLKKQDINIEPTYYPKRTPKDSLIDWNQDISSLERFIRAVPPPFNGAYSYINQRYKCVIYDIQIFDFNEFGYSSMKVGEVVQVFSGGKLLVKVFGGLILINSYKCDIEIDRGMRFGNGSEVLCIYKRNIHGNFDL